MGAQTTGEHLSVRHAGLHERGAPHNPLVGWTSNLPVLPWPRDLVLAHSDLGQGKIILGVVDDEPHGAEESHIKQKLVAMAAERGEAGNGDKVRARSTFDGAPLYHTASVFVMQ